MTRLAKVIDFLGLKRSIGALLAMVILVGMGEHLAERFLPLYLLALAGGNLSIGLMNGLDNLLSALYSFPGGYASDRLGYKRALLLFNLIALFGFLIVILFPYWYAVIIGSLFFLSWTAISLPATMSMVSRVLPTSKRTMGVSMHALVRRVPMALGPILGGVLIHAYGVRAGIRLAFMVAFVLGFVSILLQQTLIQEPTEEERKRQRSHAETNPLRVLRLLSPSLRNLLVSDILVRFCEQIPHAFVVVWCVKNVGIREDSFGILTALEMVTAMLIYVPVAYLADRSTKKPFVLVTFVFFALFPLMLYYSRSVHLLVLAFILRGLKEFGEPTRKALIMDLAPEEKKASLFGAYYLVRDVIVSVASFGGAFLWSISPAHNLFSAFGFGVAGTLWFAIFGKDLPVVRPARET